MSQDYIFNIAPLVDDLLLYLRFLTRLPVSVFPSRYIANLIDIYGLYTV